MTKRFLGSLLLLAVATIGCDDLGDPTGAACAADSTMTYANFGADFMMKYCTGCHSKNPQDGKRHGAPDDVNFDTQLQVQQHRSDIDRAVGKGPKADNKFMPDHDAPTELTNYTMPSDAEREQLSVWLACGAP
jgi:uncharacterized membrane protein